MKNHIITVENIYKNEYLIPAANAERAIEQIAKLTFNSMACNADAEKSLVRLYIRAEDEPKGSEHLFGTITMDEEEEPGISMPEEEDCACGEICAECDHDCAHCPIDALNEEVEDEPDSFEDECPIMEVLDYLLLLCARVEKLTSSFEKVCKVSAEK